jgi:hypothetical protein
VPEPLIKGGSILKKSDFRHQRLLTDTLVSN